MDPIKRKDPKSSEYITREQPDLPVELLDHILTFLEDEPTSLRACMEVNEMFSQIAEKHLYTIVRLHNQERSSSSDQLSPAQLLKLVTDSPHIASYVRCVRIDIGSVGIFRWLMARSINDEDIGSVLDMLPRVSEINLTAARRHSKAAWQGFHSTFRFSVSRILQTSTLTRVFIKNIDAFPLKLLNTCVSLKSLMLSGTFVFDESGYKPQSSGSLPKVRSELDTLSLRLDSTNSLQNIVSWFQSDGSPTLSTLTSLRLCAERNEDYPHFASILYACSSLKKLGLYLGAEIRTMYDIMNNVVQGTAQPQPFDLSTMQNLKYLKIKSAITSSSNFWIASNGEDTHEDFFYTNPFPWIERMLLPVSERDNKLQTLVFDIILDIELHDLRRLRWESLTTLLRSMWLSSALKKVEMRVASSPTNSSLDVARLIQALQADEHLSQLIDEQQYLNIIQLQD